MTRRRPQPSGPSAGARTVRCAIYTRKSSEEGLDQAFNSLDAQREAGLDYARSQKHDGWACLPERYDDGGYSGGSTDRPALQRLLADIRAGRIDVVLVYKVDRLSRSLADFARLMQVFDQHRVSFVSVTPQFNTTTSMGRLTLNMLLSFAQFEREVAGERIRDKIAATKRRGVWVCGRPPLGYAIDRSGPERALRIVDAEADLVRSIYAGYLELGSLVGLATRLAAQGHLTRRVEGRGGPVRGGRRFTTGDLHRILTNPLYVGRITHRRRADGVVEVHPGVHEPIVDQATWDAVRARMDRPTPRTPGAWTHTHLLKGKIRTAHGAAMSPGSTHRPRSKRAGAQAETRPVRYYVSQQAIRHGFAACPIKNLNARHIDDLVRALVLDHARRAHGLDLAALGPTARDHHVRALVEAVEVDVDRLVLVLDESAVHDAVDAVREARRASGNRTASAPKQHDDTLPTCPFQPRVQSIDTPGGPHTKLVLDVQIKRLDGRRVLLAPDGRDLLSTVTPQGEQVPRPHLVRALAQAHRWRERLVRLGHSVEDIARDEAITAARVSHIVPLAYLPPETTRAVLTGTLPESVTLAQLTDRLPATTVNDRSILKADRKQRHWGGGDPFDLFDKPE